MDLVSSDCRRIYILLTIIVLVEHADHVMTHLVGKTLTVHDLAPLGHKLLVERLFRPLFVQHFLRFQSHPTILDFEWVLRYTFLRGFFHHVFPHTDNHLLNKIVFLSFSNLVLNTLLHYRCYLYFFFLLYLLSFYRV